MSLSRVTTWSSGQVLTASALNGEFNNILSNAISLISPLTAGLAAGGFDITDVDELEFTSAGANATAAGRIRRNAANLTWHDGTAARRFALKTTGDELIFADAAGDASAAGYLTRNGVNLTWHNGTAAGRVFFAGGADVPIADGGTGISTLPTNGQLLIGKTSDNTWNPATLTAGTGITVTNGAGAVTVANAGVIVLSKVTNNVSVSNTVTETSIFSYSVPANTLGTNNALRLTVRGRWSCTGSSPTLTASVKYGTATFAQPVLQSNAVAQTDKGFLLDVLLAADGSTSAQYGWAAFIADAVSTNNQINSVARGTANTEDSTTTLTFEVTVTWSAASASNTFILEHAFLEFIQ